MGQKITKSINIQNLIELVIIPLRCKKLKQPIAVACVEAYDATVSSR